MSHKGYQGCKKGNFLFDFSKCAELVEMATDLDHAGIRCALLLSELPKRPLPSSSHHSARGTTKKPHPSQHGAAAALQNNELQQQLTRLAASVRKSQQLVPAESMARLKLVQEESLRWNALIGKLETLTAMEIQREHRLQLVAAGQRQQQSKLMSRNAHTETAASSWLCGPGGEPVVGTAEGSGAAAGVPVLVGRQFRQSQRQAPSSSLSGSQRQATPS